MPSHSILTSTLPLAPSALTYNDVFMLMREAFFTPMPLTLLIAKASVASPAGGGH